MHYSLDHAIRGKLARYLISEITLDEFEDWFVSTSWNILHKEDYSTIELIYDIELLIAEYSDGCWNENELKGLLRPLVENYKINQLSVPRPEYSSTQQQNYWLKPWVSARILY